MKIATHNVNSIRTRYPRVIEWLQKNDIDVLAMQEIKCRPDQFPTQAFKEAGYEVIAHGLNQWNGVAFASRLKMSDISISFDDMPGFGEPGPKSVTFDNNGKPLEARALAVTVNSIRLWSLYAPNGRDLEHAHYAYKLDWFSALADSMQKFISNNPAQALFIMGDFNIAPYDSDMGDPSFIKGKSTHISAREREAFAKLQSFMVDTVRPFDNKNFTYWDYKAAKFLRNQGMRIDFILANSVANDLVVDAKIHVDERKGDSPSDHVPVQVQLDFDLLGQDAQENDNDADALSFLF